MPSPSHPPQPADSASSGRHRRPESLADVTATFHRLQSRTGLEQIEPIKQKRVYGVYHHFYNHPYNIIGMEILAKDLYPEVFRDLDPTADYHHIVTHFTGLPDAPVILSTP